VNQQDIGILSGRASRRRLPTAILSSTRHSSYPLKGAVRIKKHLENMYPFLAFRTNTANIEKQVIKLPELETGLCNVSCKDK